MDPRDFEFINELLEGEAQLKKVNLMGHLHKFTEMTAYAEDPRTRWRI
jgi:hypothetical protein